MRGRADQTLYLLAIFFILLYLILFYVFELLAQDAIIFSVPLASTARARVQAITTVILVA